MVEGWAAVAGIAAAVGAAAAVAGVTYNIYSAENPPKTAGQAQKGLSQSQSQLAKLKAKRAEVAAAGKDTSKLDVAIGKVQDSISYLNSFIASHSATGTPVGSPVNTGVANQPGQTNWPVLIGGGVLTVGAVIGAVYLVKKKKGK